MKHAIMIMAHKNFEFLHHLIEYFSRDCYVFVHIDKKSSITRDEEACLRAMPQVSGVYRKYSVHWGGFSILKCEIFLMKKILRVFLIWEYGNFIWDRSELQLSIQLG